MSRNTSVPLVPTFVRTRAAKGYKRRNRDTSGETSHGVQEENGAQEEKAGSQTADLEQRPRGRAKGRVYAGAGEADTTRPHGSRGGGSEGFVAVLLGDRHHAAGTGAAQSDRQGCRACRREDSLHH